MQCSRVVVSNLKPERDMIGYLMVGSHRGAPLSFKGRVQGQRSAWNANLRQKEKVRSQSQEKQQLAS